MHEIITLQLGQRSNYVATHFWNAQESYFTYPGEAESIIDHDIHFRAGLGVGGAETYTPRTLIYDLKGGYGSLKKFNELYEVDEGHDLLPGLWDRLGSIQQQPPIEKSQYQKDLEEGIPPQPLSTATVRYWSDFNRLFYHPKSIVQLNEYELNSRLMPFEDWNAGEELFNSLNREHDLLDRDFRSFAEECDHLQGVQMLTGIDDAWGGFAARYLDRLRDEYGKTSIWVWGVQDGQSSSRASRMQKSVGAARSILNMPSQASMFIPMVDPPAQVPDSVRVDRLSEWHTSGLLSTAMETMSLPARLRPLNSTRSTLRDMEDVLRREEKQNIAVLRLGLGAVRERSLASHRGDEFSLFPRTRLPPTQHASRVLTILEVRRQEAAHEMSTDQPSPGASAANGDLGAIAAQSYYTPLPFPLPDSFPTIYDAAPASSRPSSIEARASLSIETSVGHEILDIRSAIGRAIALDEREILLNDLGDIAEAYRDGWYSGTDSDEDDL